MKADIETFRRKRLRRRSGYALGGVVLIAIAAVILLLIANAIAPDDNEQTNRLSNQENAAKSPEQSSSGSTGKETLESEQVHKSPKAPFSSVKVKSLEAQLKNIDALIEETSKYAQRYAQHFRDSQGEKFRLKAVEISGKAWEILNALIHEYG